MTVVDFRSSGGFEGSQPQRLAHDYSNARGDSQGQGEYWQDGGWDDHHHHYNGNEQRKSSRTLG